MMHKCNKCEKIKDFKDFPKNKDYKLGIGNICKSCKKEYKKLYRLSNYIKLNEYNSDYYLKNKEKILKHSKIYSFNNREKINKRNAEKLANNPILKLTPNLRKVINHSFKNKHKLKKGRTTSILGCSIQFFKTYIESLFEPWMNWDNYGNPKDGKYELNKTWDLDHIIPISSAKTEEEIIKLNHYTNFQPLCSYTNRWIKSNYI